MSDLEIRLEARVRRMWLVQTLMSVAVVVKPFLNKCQTTWLVNRIVNLLVMEIRTGNTWKRLDRQ